VDPTIAKAMPMTWFKGYLIVSARCFTAAPNDASNTPVLTQSTGGSPVLFNNR
jgi:hypothetical protein